MHLQTKFFRTSSLLVLLMLALVLAGCAGVGTSESTETVATATPTDVVEPIAEPTAELAEEPAVESPAKPAVATENSSETGGPRTFSIVQDCSEVRFVIDEVLRGQPTTVVGVNTLVTGDILIDQENPGTSQIGTIAIDANRFVTDSDQRNGAIRRFILLPGQYPTITFTPANVSGLPERVSVGETFDIQVTGDLSILATTNPVTFDLTVSVLSEDEITVTGATTIARSDYGLTIPSVPFVSSVEEELALELDLVAVAGG